MAIINAGNSGGGLFSSIIPSLVGLGAAFIPGLQGIAPYLIGASQLAGGNTTGGLMSLIGAQSAARPTRATTSSASTATACWPTRRCASTSRGSTRASSTNSVAARR